MTDHNLPPVGEAPPAGDTKGRLQLFFDFIVERHRIWHRRHVLRQPYPWTTHPVLRDAFFTNVYRRLDPGTQLIEHYLAPLVRTEDALFMALLYRTGLHDASLEEVGHLGTLETWDQDEYMGILSARRQAGQQVWTSAYMVGNLHQKGVPKEQVYGRVLQGVFEMLAGGWSPEGGSMRDATDVLRKLWGIGQFIAFQSLVDTTYQGFFQPTDPDWALAGPGAQKGLKALGWQLRDDLVLDMARAEAIRELAEEFNLLRLGDMPAQPPALKPTPVDPYNMQNCLCEFSKFIRIMEGGQMRRGYRPDANRGPA